MQIDVITAFPEILKDPLEQSIIKQAQKRINLNIVLHNLRDYAHDKHRTLDDTPYGGGPGMILKAEPLFEAINSIAGDQNSSQRIVFPTPQGEVYHQEKARSFARQDHLIFICGHYKAVDQRVIDTWVSDEVSVGDFILSGGEIPALMIIDSVVRLLPGAIGDFDSALTDSFENGLLDCPYYTRPENYQGLGVPEVLLSGNHAKIAEWRQQQRLQRTAERRPDLYKKYTEGNQ